MRWTTQKATDGGLIYRLHADGYEIAALFRAKAGWVASGPRLSRRPPFLTLAAAKAFCEGDA